MPLYSVKERRFIVPTQTITLRVSIKLRFLYIVNRIKESIRLFIRIHIGDYWPPIYVLKSYRERTAFGPSPLVPPSYLDSLIGKRISRDRLMYLMELADKYYDYELEEV
jgi:hypothetical protein